MDDLARQLATAIDRRALSRLLEEHLRARLAASRVVVYLLQADGLLATTSEAMQEGLERLPADMLAHGPRPELLSALGTELVVRIPDRAERPVGLVVLGRRANGRDFSPDDHRELEAVAAQAGVTLEIILRAEQLAERMEAQRDSDREIGIAREVQRRLLPQRSPALETLELAACCEQAQSVGGDYYDYLEAGEGQMAFVLADVSGKGMPAALRMANLQAHLRSQLASAPRDPLRVLRQVNRMLCEGSEPGHFATLFLGVYSDGSRRFSYINCGHNPPLCLRRDGSVEWLHATATVLGSFEDWTCTLGRTTLAAGDLLVVYSDGVTEAGHGDQLFGEQRLLDALRGHGEEPLDKVLARLVGRVQAFGDGAPMDDLTLLIARGR